MRPEPAPIVSSLRVCGLFSGVGGLELGLHKAGHRTIGMCESDPHARVVLAERFPGTEVHDDIVAMKELPDCDLVAAGWPCQDLSLAGRTRGMTGPRSGLISEVFRLLKAAPRMPPFVLLENVAFALDLQRGGAVRYVVSELERLGYRWAFRVLDTLAFGLPQRRRRLFILGALEVDPSAILMDGAVGDPTDVEDKPSLIGFYWTEGNRGLGWSPEAVPPLKGGSGVGIPSPPAVWERSTGRFICPGIEDAERLQGFDPGWTTPAGALDRGARRRWSLIGNAVSVPVAEWIGRRLGSPISPPAGGLDKFTQGYSVKAGYGGPGRKASLFSPRREGPAVTARSRLTDFGLRDAVPASRRAISGFARRYEASPLRKDADFLAALKEWAPT